MYSLQGHQRTAATWFVVCSLVLLPFQTACNPAMMHTDGNALQRMFASVKDTIAPGVFGRFASVLVLHPLDTVKTRSQVVSTVSRRTAEAAVYRSPSTFRGVSPAIAGQIPHGILTCIGYEIWKEVLLDKLPDLDRRVRSCVCAVLGDLTGHLWLTPMEMLKSQLQIGLHKDIGSAVSATSKKGVLAFYKGYTGQVARDVPYRVLQLVLYEELCRFFAAQKRARLTLEESVAVGAFAGCTAAVATTPLDLLKSRLMVQSGQQGLVEVMASAFKREGSAVFTSSMVPQLLRVCSTTAAFLAVLQVTRSRMEPPKPKKRRVDVE